MEDDILEMDSPEEPVIDELEDDAECSQDEAPPVTLGKLPVPVEKPRAASLDHPLHLPYPTESLDEMDHKLDQIVRRLVDCVRAKDYDVGFVQWNHRLECWLSLKYPMKREIRAKLAKLYFELCVLPGMDARLVDIACIMAMSLLESKKRIDISDLQLPWRPIYAILDKELFPKQRKTGLTNVSTTLLNLVEFSQRFFPPHEIPAMLHTFLPRVSSSLNSILATQAFCVHFLPISHPQYYLPALFKLWESFNSEIWDSQWLDFMERLNTKHLNPSESDPDLVEELRQRSAQQYTTSASDLAATSDAILHTVEATGEWKGIRRSVGIFTDEQWAFIMTKCLRGMGVPLGAGSKILGEGIIATDLAVADTSATGVALTMKRPTEKLSSFASLIVYSICVDSPVSGASTPTTTTTAGDGTQRVKTYLAGSKALDSLATLTQATEGFFHPSNYGSWAVSLSRFLRNVTFAFNKRQCEEERADCKTPPELRLTPALRHHFVLTMRTVALLSMYSRDPVTVGNSQAALKTMALLEPELIFPSVLERAYPALEALLETHRTTATITALSTLSPALVSRANYPAGAQHLVPLLELCLPGLDVNDPIKTMSTAMFVIQGVSSIMIDDLTRPDAQDETVYGDDAAEMELDGAGERKTTRAELDNAVRDSTAGFPDWVANFFRQVLVVFEALPEPGKGSRNGGKMEDTMTQTLIAACDFVCSQLSPSLFDLALSIVYNHITSSIRSNSARVVSQLTSCFARANSTKTLARFLPVCALNIRSELEQGASSTRTTSSQNLIESDLALHWWIGILTGAVTNAGENLLVHKQVLMELLQLMLEHTKSERGYTSAGRILAIMIVSLTNHWARDHRSVNADEWSSKEWAQHHHEKWGRLYLSKDVVVDWHVPSQPEIDFALELLQELVVPALDRLDSLLSQSSNSSVAQSPAWTNDFCRYCNIVRSALSGMTALVLLPSDSVTGQVASDAGDEVPEFIDYPPHCEGGICLTDTADPRHAFVMQLRARSGETLHASVAALKNNGAEDSIDCVKMLIASIRVLEIDYPCDHLHYTAVKKSYEFALTITRTARNQKLFPRFVWVRRASLYHASRLRLNSFYRKRTLLDDKLIADMCELSLSMYVQVRRAAQKGLDSMTHYFDGARSILFDRLFDSLKPGTDHDVMKGALYVLGSKMFGNLAILDWRHSPRYLMALLSCSHQERPSVQNLVTTISHDFIIRLAEPSTLKASVKSESLNLAADQLDAVCSIVPDVELVARVAQKARDRVDWKNTAFDGLLPQLLAVASSPESHWRYSLTATRFLRALVRRDQPLRADLAIFFAEQLVSDSPKQRTHCMLALTKYLHFIKLRTACAGSGEKLLLQQTSNPLRRNVVLEHPLPSNFTAKFIESFSKPIDRDTLLMDKQSTGWLVWGSSVDFYAVPPENSSAIEWDPTSRDAIAQLRKIIIQAAWWETFISHLAQEKTIDYLASDVTTVIKSIFQIFGAEPLEFVLPILHTLVVDKDRHKQRAAAELIGGMLRGSKHWSVLDQNKIWSWLTPLLPEIFQGVTPETQVAWEMCVEYILSSRDPRRNQPLVDYLTTLVIDPESSEAFNVAKSQDLVGSAMKSLGWHFSPWADKYIDMYSQHLDHSFTEVRSALADNLRCLSELRLHPSYSSVDVFMKACHDEPGPLMATDGDYEAKIDEFVVKLAELRLVRQSTANGTQAYDRAASTMLNWIFTSVSDFRITSAFPFIDKLLPEFFRMQEILDNQELRSTAFRVVIAVVCLPLPQDIARALMKQFLSLLRDSDSWRVRLDVLLPLQMFYFNNIFSLDDELIAELVEQLCKLLRDPKIEVREAAASALSGVVRCSQRSTILTLRDRFMSVIRATKIPKRRNAAGIEVEGYAASILEAHSAVLGITAIINAFPYEVPAFIPAILIECMGKHSTSPPPISTAVKLCLSDFKKNHTDSWAEDQKMFSEEQLAELHDLLTGSSYYA